jgi:hypothetical protein
VLLDQVEDKILRRMGKESQREGLIEIPGSSMK